jgi:TolB-like protein
MTGELITEISRIQALKVISRTSVMGYKSTREHLPQIARELGSDDIVEGSIMRDGDQVRITVQLLDAPNDRHLWSEDYQRPLGSILTFCRSPRNRCQEKYCSTQSSGFEIKPFRLASINPG